MASLPPIATEDALAAISRDEAALRPGVEELATLIRINPDDLTRYPAGSRPVYAAGDLVLKLFPPVAGWPDQRIEARVLAAAARQLLVTEDRDGIWQLSGLIDFEPAMRGDREYEFVGVAAFVAEGDARFLAQTLASYGYQPDQLGPDLRRRLLALGILHRYGNLSWWMQRLPEPACPTLDALADCWFATS